MSEMGFAAAVASESLKDTFASTSFYHTVAHREMGKKVFCDNPRPSIE
jgi:hypothetical protein